MTPEDFYAARELEDDGWEFIGTSDAGDMVFTRLLGGLVYVAEIRLEG